MATTTDHHFSAGQDVWVVAGHSANVRSAEHAAKVVRGILQSTNSDDIMVEWQTTGTAEVVSIYRVRPMYDNWDADADAVSSGTSCADTSSVPQPLRPKQRKSRRVSTKPDRFDNCFASSRYQRMSVSELREKCKQMDIDTRGCAKGDMIALIVKKEEEGRWRRGGGGGKSQQQSTMTKESGRSNGENQADPRKSQTNHSKKARPQKKSSKATKKSAAHRPKPPNKSLKPTKKKITPRKVNLSHRLAAIFSPRNNGPKNVASNNPRRISEIRRRRNDMEDRVRTQLLTARKKSRKENDENDERTGGANSTSNKMGHNAEEDDGRDDSFSDNDDVTSGNENGGAAGMNSPETACYSEPSSPNIDNDRDDTKIQCRPSDRIQILYCRLHMAKADSIQTIEALEKMKNDGGYDLGDMDRLKKWKAESCANVDRCHSLLNRALVKEGECSLPSGQVEELFPAAFCV